MITDTKRPNNVHLQNGSQQKEHKEQYTQEQQLRV